VRRGRKNNQKQVIDQFFIAPIKHQNKAEKITQLQNAESAAFTPTHFFWHPQQIHKN
jgi:hypothetical protein